MSTAFGRYSLGLIKELGRRQGLAPEVISEITRKVYEDVDF